MSSSGFPARRNLFFWTETVVDDTLWMTNDRAGAEKELAASET